eukprot:gb/GEZN01007651.1/.p1 GENE.gb/GEZN01007651.1/~~gb/GEZN01007651.1/.p1  ORF type:complete len:422 (-),score=51.67 gb/GEZN01007651.1/:180-1445(-)
MRRVFMNAARGVRASRAGAVRVGIMGATAPELSTNYFKLHASRFMAVNAGPAVSKPSVSGRGPLSGPGPRTVKAYMVKKAGQSLELGEVTLPALKDNEVQVEISHCGLCHTDIHMRDNDWGVADYPLVAGHEGVGKVSLVGPKVTNLKVGDLVGIGWIRDSCGSCAGCEVGKENLCRTGYQGTYLAGSAAGIWGKNPSNLFGCFSEAVRINSKFAFKVPEGVSLEEAAPLLCAGTTLFEPIADYVTMGTKVGVVSYGGLGAMGVKFAEAVGADVTVVSRTASKKGKALANGAHHFIVSENDAEMKAAAGSLDVLLDTTPVPNNVPAMMNLLRFGGTYCLIGIPPASAGDIKGVGYIPTVFTGRKIAGSIVCGSVRTKAMMELCARNKIGADVQVMPFQDINKAMELLTSQKATKSRIVLKW